jgi:hypothetical protein
MLRKIWEYDSNSIIDDISFLETNEKIFISSNKKIFCFNFKNRKLWDFELKKKAEIITALHGDKLIIIPKGIFEHQKEILYFNTNGKLLWTFKLPLGYHVVGIDISPTGKKIVVGMNDKFIVLDNKGKSLWERQFSNWKEKSNVESVSISKNNKYFVVVANYSIIAFDLVGNKLFENKIKKWRDPYEVKISNNGNIISRVGYGLLNGGLYYLNINGEILWNYDLNSIPDKIDISNNGDYIICSMNGTIYIFNNKGELINQFTIRNPKVLHFSENENKIYGATEKSYFHYDISDFLRN